MAESPLSIRLGPLDKAIEAFIRVAYAGKLVPKKASLLKRWIEQGLLREVASLPNPQQKEVLHGFEKGTTFPNQFPADGAPAGRKPGAGTKAAPQAKPSFRKAVDPEAPLPAGAATWSQRARERYLKRQQANRE